MDIIDEIGKRGQLVNETIPKLLSITRPEELYKAGRHLLDAGGKRLRPTTLILAAEAVGGEAEHVLPAAVSIEIIHNFTLIHDDIMDQADLRRGMPAVHVKWGTSGAIIAGDALYSKAFEILASVNRPPERVVQCVSLLSKTCTDICEGQWMDISFEKRAEVTEQEYLDMVEKKTGVLYAASAKIGAILGGATREEADALWEFGRLAGIGFQIYDDVLDLITPEVILGKDRGGDIIEGKQTLIAIHALNKGVKIDIFGKGKATKKEMDDALLLLRESGSLDYAMNKAISYVEEGKSKLGVLKDTKARKLLLGLADYMLERKY